MAKTVNLKLTKAQGELVLTALQLARCEFLDESFRTRRTLATIPCVPIEHQLQQAIEMMGRKVEEAETLLKIVRDRLG